MSLDPAREFLDGRFERRDFRGELLEGLRRIGFEDPLQTAGNIELELQLQHPTAELGIGKSGQRGRVLRERGATVVAVVCHCKYWMLGNGSRIDRPAGRCKRRCDPDGA